jgi:hypothetical protein
MKSFPAQKDLRPWPRYTLLVAAPDLRADDWPQWLGLRRDDFWRETGILV